MWTGQGLGRGRPLPEVARPGLSISPQYSVLREHGSRALHHELLGDYFSNNKSKESVLNNSFLLGVHDSQKEKTCPASQTVSTALAAARATGQQRQPC